MLFASLEEIKQSKARDNSLVHQLCRNFNQQITYIFALCLIKLISIFNSRLINKIKQKKEISFDAYVTVDFGIQLGSELN